MAALEAVVWGATNTPFDRFLRGDTGALSGNERAGLELLYGRAQCATCHSGSLMTDLDYHAIGVPQIGPGKGDGTDGRHDFGRERVTGARVDRMRFRTPQLRNVPISMSLISRS